MAILQIDEFNNIVTAKSALLGLDVGKKRIGIAMVDTLRIAPFAIKNLDRVKFIKDMEVIFGYYDEYNCKGIVIGWPLQMDGTKGAMCQSVRDFTLEMLKIRDVPCCFVDERLSSFASEDMLISEFNLSRNKRKKILDKLSAQTILQRYLEQAI